jgi:TPR repeat protein
LEWFRKAANQGYAKAQYNLGVIYAQGKGVPEDFSEALLWLRKAQAQGFEQAAEAIEFVLQAQQLPIPIGTRVELRGLKGKPELNGQRGVVVGFSAASGRCKVELEGGRGQFSLKPENIA